MEKRLALPTGDVLAFGNRVTETFSPSLFLHLRWEEQRPCMQISRGARRLIGQPRAADGEVDSKDKCE